MGEKSNQFGCRIMLILLKFQKSEWNILKNRWSSSFYNVGSETIWKIKSSMSLLFISIRVENSRHYSVQLSVSNRPSGFPKLLKIIGKRHNSCFWLGSQYWWYLYIKLYSKSEQKHSKQCISECEKALKTIIGN